MLRGVTTREEIDSVREGEITRERKFFVIQQTFSAYHVSGTILGTRHRALHNPNKTATPVSLNSGVSSGERGVFDSGFEV